MPHLTRLTFPDLRLATRDAPKLRGYFAAAFGSESVLFHNHHDDGGFRYGYPLIQYKVLGGVPTVIGVAEGAELLLNAFLDLRELELDGQRVPVNSKELQADTVTVGLSDRLNEFRFATPYFPFTQDNYRKFRDLSPDEQPAELERLLTNHLVQALRSLGSEVTPDRPILLKARLRPRQVNFKNQRMQMYSGDFVANVDFPAGLGIGKSTSRGFGTVMPGDLR